MHRKQLAGSINCSREKTLNSFKIKMPGNVKLKVCTIRTKRKDRKQNKTLMFQHKEPGKIIREQTHKHMDTDTKMQLRIFFCIPCIHLA